MAKGDASCEAAGGADAQNRCCANKIVEKTVQDDEFCGKASAFFESLGWIGLQQMVGSSDGVHWRRPSTCHGRRLASPLSSHHQSA